MLRRIIQSEGLFVKLPAEIAAKIDLRGSVAVLRFSASSDCGGASSSFFAAWNGSMSQSEAVVVPEGLIPEVAEEATVTVVEGVPRAREVEIVPLSQYDWEVVNAQTAAVEAAMLRQMAIVVTGGLLRLRLSASVQIQFRVSHFKPEGLNTCLYPDVALLTSETAVLIAPPPLPLEAVARAQWEAATQALISELSERVSPTYSLRILPQCFRGCYTGFHVDEGGRSSLNRAPATSDDSLHLLSVLESLEKCSPGGPQIPPRLTPPDWVNDQLTCITHPSFLLNVAELAASQAEARAAGLGWQDIWAGLGGAEGFVIAALRKCAPSALLEKQQQKLAQSLHAGSAGEAEAAVALSDHVVVKVAFCESVRPFSMSMPVGLRRALCLLDWDRVQIHLSVPMSSQRGGNGVSSTRIGLGLRPVRWVSADTTTIPEPPPLALAQPLLPKAGALRSALAQLCGSADGCPGPLVLSRGSVLTLTAGNPPQLIDVVVELCASSAAVESGATEGDSSHSFVSLAEDADEEELLALLDGLSLARVPRVAHLPAALCGGGPARSVLPVASSLLGFSSVQTALLLEALPCLLPQAISARTRLDIAPSPGVILCGPRGSGRSALCRNLGLQLSLCAATVAHHEHVDCRLLVGRSAAGVRAVLATAIARAEWRAPSIITFDDLDCLFPADSDSSAEALASELGDMLDGLQRRAEEAHRAARALVTRGVEGRGSCGMEGAPALERAVTLVLSSAVFVLVTAASSASLLPCLQRLPYRLRKELKVPALSAHARLGILSKALGGGGDVVDPNQLDLSQCDAAFAISCGDAAWVKRLSAAVEGFRPADLHALALRAGAVAAKRRYSEPQQQLQQGTASVVTAADLMVALEGFAPLAQSVNARNSSARATTWADVGGLAAAKTQARDLFETPSLFRSLFRHPANSAVRLPRSALLYGPPGCGKTLFAEAVAASFFSPSCFEAIHGPALLDKYIGASERAVRDLFERARANGRPTLIFFDELEALAPKRGRDTTGVTDRVVNQLLTLLDGVEASMGGGGGSGEGEGEGDGGEVYVLAASSRPDLIDAALLRPGRIERHIYLGLPCQADRVAILHAALRRLRTAADVDQAVEEIALHPDCAQFTSADLGAVAKTAFLAATREGGVRDSCGVVTGRLLREAFSATRPSLSARDVAFYDGINGRFSGAVGVSAGGSGVGQKQALI